MKLISIIYPFRDELGVWKYIGPDTSKIGISIYTNIQRTSNWEILEMHIYYIFRKT